MKFGASTACFYPMLTEESLTQVIDIGFERAEIFMNAPSELEPPFINELNKIAQDSGTKIISVHPFSSFLESSCIFGDYQRRYDYFIDVYKKKYIEEKAKNALLISEIATLKASIDYNNIKEKVDKLFQ